MQIASNYYLHTTKKTLLFLHSVYRIYCQFIFISFILIHKYNYLIYGVLSNTTGGAVAILRGEKNMILGK